MAMTHKLTTGEQRSTDYASIVLTEKGIDPLHLMNDLATWKEPPQPSEKWERKLAAACEMATGFCKIAQNEKDKVFKLKRYLRKLITNVDDVHAESGHRKAIIDEIQEYLHSIGG